MYGTAIHRATGKKLTAAPGGRWKVYHKSPDFGDNWRGGRVELTTGGQYGGPSYDEHVGRPGLYPTSMYVLYDPVVRMGLSMR